jgi:small-conductance mechanosensitive channel
LIYAWLTFAMLQFPYSQPWGQQLGAFLINLFRMLGTGLVRAIPGVFTVFVIFQLTRIVARVVDSIFSKVERGELVLSWIHRDTARATRQLVMVLIWIFALTVAYPYIPGSSTDAFKGISVFVGLMASLGSAGFVNQLMSGLVVIYSRALRTGEFVRVGDDTWHRY